MQVFFPQIHPKTNKRAIPPILTLGAGPDNPLVLSAARQPRLLVDHGQTQQQGLLLQPLALHEGVWLDCGDGRGAEGVVLRVYPFEDEEEFGAFEEVCGGVQGSGEGVLPGE